MRRTHFRAGARLREVEAPMAELERLAGRQSLEWEMAEKPAGLEFTAREKQVIAMKLMPAYPVRLVCQVSGLPRSLCYYHCEARD